MTPGLLPGLIIYNIIVVLQSVQRNTSSSLTKCTELYTNMTTKLFLIIQCQEADKRLQFCRNLRNKLC